MLKHIVLYRGVGRSKGKSAIAHTNTFSAVLPELWTGTEVIVIDPMVIGVPCYFHYYRSIHVIFPGKVAMVHTVMHAAQQHPVIVRFLLWRIVIYNSCIS